MIGLGEGKRECDPKTQTDQAINVRAKLMLSAVDYVGMNNVVSLDVYIAPAQVNSISQSKSSRHSTHKAYRS